MTKYPMTNEMFDHGSVPNDATSYRPLLATVVPISIDVGSVKCLSSGSVAVIMFPWILLAIFYPV